MTDKIVHTTLDVERRSFERRFIQKHYPAQTFVLDSPMVKMLLQGAMQPDGTWEYGLTHVQFAWAGWQMCLSAHDTVMA